MRCVVTGGLGFIGSHLTDTLIKEGHEVIVIDNLHSGFTSFSNPKAITLKLDINSQFADEIAKTLHVKSEDLKIDVIFHLAAESNASSSFADPLYTFQTNVTGTLNVLEVAKKTGARVVYASSGLCKQIDCKPIELNPYISSKWFGEETSAMYNRIHNVPVAIARIFNAYGPRQPSVGTRASVIGVFEEQKKAKTRLTIRGDGHQTRDFIHVFDVVEALILMGEQTWNGEIFEIGTGENYSINEVATLFEGSVKFIPLKSKEAKHPVADIYYTTEKLGWRPIIDLEDYIDHFLDENFPLAGLRVLNLWNKVKKIWSH